MPSPAINGVFKDGVLTEPVAGQARIPLAVLKQIVAFQDAKVSGWIQLNFNAGDLQSWQRHEQHRVTSA